MANLVVDTHAAVWYLQNSNRLSPVAQRAMDDAADAGDLVYVSSISLVEIIYLVEKGKLPAVVIEQLTTALSDSDSAFAIAPLDEAAALAVQRISRDIIPDMPDRIIAATALSLGFSLVTRDSAISKAGITTIW
jgi:PIN domain nuclease of toxin-antitoxin system